MTTTYSSKLKKTGQIESYYAHDDGDYQKGVEPNYSRNAEIVTDHVTGLEWQDNEEVKTVTKTWEDAKSYCSNLTLGGKSDWRLPTVIELKSIIDYGKYNPSINSVFVNTYSNYYWSSTSYSSASSSAWVVTFYDGYVYNSHKTNNYYVRCVRAGQ